MFNFSPLQIFIIVVYRVKSATKAQQLRIAFVLCSTNMLLGVGVDVEYG